MRSLRSIVVTLLAGAALWVSPGPALAEDGGGDGDRSGEASAEPNLDPSVDIAAEHRAALSNWHGRRPYRPVVRLDREEMRWAYKRWRLAYLPQAVGASGLILGVGAGLLTEMLGLLVWNDPYAHLGFSVAGFVGTGVGGLCALGAASLVRGIHRRWRTGPLWPGRITGMVLWGVSLGAAGVAVVGSVAELSGDVGQFSTANRMVTFGGGFSMLFGIPATIVLLVDIGRHRRPLRRLDLARARDFARREPPIPAVVPWFGPQGAGLAIGWRD